MAATHEYRIEVATRDFSHQQRNQFVEEATRAGFSVVKIHNGWMLAIFDLTEQQAITVRDGLDEVGIHASIGIASRQSV